MQENHIITTNNLAIGYTNKKTNNVIAKNLNLSLFKGSFVCLIGKNGVGKSTLLRTLSKTQEALSGNILIDNKDLNQYDNLALSKQVSLVLTEKIPPSNLTVFEVVALARQIYTDWIGRLSQNDIEIVNDALSICNLNFIKDKKIDELSDGQFQKVMIARAIAQDTPIIILDEPTAHLDIINRVEIFHLLKKLAKEKNKLILCSSHEIELCLEYASHLWLMTLGNILCDSKENILKSNDIATVFNSDLIEFDAKNKQFKYK
ncbi:MAG TPA: ABC transporter ATP-binding protein [Flavobacteriia bacterium]|nr:ABC transporter ATP-binding protein [Flavobacteriia bacterium]